MITSSLPELRWVRSLDGRTASVRVFSVLLDFRVQRFGKCWRLVWTIEGKRLELVCETEEAAMSHAATVVASTYAERNPQ